jgi:ketosteroid isomerase-like protein
MNYPQYGVTHPYLAGPIPLIRHHAQAIVAAWPGAMLVRRTLRTHRGFTGCRSTWESWEPAPPTQVPERTAPDGPPRVPSDLPILWAERHNAADLDALLDLYEPGAILAGDNLATLRHAGLRDALAAKMAEGVPVEVHNRHVLATDGLALLITDWTLEGPNRQGTFVRDAGRSTDIARIGGDGIWRYVIDNPAGTDW